MGRSEARVQFGAFSSGLKGHGAHAKLVYVVVLTEPTINHCGVGAIRMGRWAREASLTIGDTEQALKELRSGDLPQLVLDEETEEVFVRTLIRNDRVAEQPYVLKGALREALKVESPIIRRVLAAELRKLPAKAPDRKGANGKSVTYPDPHAVADKIDPGAPPEPTGKGFETLSTDTSETPETLPFEKGFESLPGGGGGDGGGSSVGSSSTTAARKPRQPRNHPDTADGRAKRLADAYYERNPLCSYMGVVKLVKRAIAHHDDAAIERALTKLADTNRPVTGNTLLVALQGPDLQAVPASDSPWADYRPTGTESPWATGRGQR